jgi:hypothetical protein
MHKSDENNVLILHLWGEVLLVLIPLFNTIHIFAVQKKKIPPDNNSCCISKCEFSITKQSKKMHKQTRIPPNNNSCWILSLSG